MPSLAVAALALLLVASPALPEGDPAASVDLFTGTAARAPDFGTGGGAGNTFPGATAPFGMLQWSPDTVPGTTNFAGGYSYEDSHLHGFSLTHLSGTGCAVFQDVPILPTTVPVTRSPSVAGTYDVDPMYVPAFSHADEEASPGFYRVRLDPGTTNAIDVALAARTRSAVGRFTFPASATSTVLFNAGGSAMANGDVALTVDPDAREVSGAVSAGQFCYHRNHYTLYFAVRFGRPFAAWGTWHDQVVAPGTTTTTAHVASPFQLRGVPGATDTPHTSTAARAGAWVTFDTTTDPAVAMRVGVSYVDVAGARSNLDAESPDYDVDGARAATRAAWNALLGRVAVSGGPPGTTRTFYTMLYHALLAPTVFSDVDGAYAGMDGQRHTTAGWTQYANFSGWDIEHGAIQLLALLDPARTSDMVSSLLADARESGWLPKWPVANGQTDVQVGDPAAPIVAGAWAFGARSFDTAEALAALVKGATQSGTSPNAAYVERQGLDAYLRLGYVPHDGTEFSTGATNSTFGAGTSAVWGSATTTLEYVAADFAIARFAAALGDRAAYRTFMRRSDGWRKLVNPASHTIEPRYASGAFKSRFDPLSLEGFVEGDAAQYTWLVPFNPRGLFAALGGRRTASARLDAHLAKLNEGPKSPNAFLGDEPEMGVPWLYDWLGAPWKTQRTVRQALLTLFDSSPGGYPGNDDLGAMSAWYVFGALGFYPAVPGEDVLALGSPLFPHATLHLAGGDLRIDAPRAAAETPYVHGLELDGRRHDQAWLRFRDVACGGRLRFALAGTPSRAWGRRREAPSFPAGARLPMTKARRCSSQRATSVSERTTSGTIAGHPDA